MKNRLKELREKKGLTLDDIENITGIKRGTFNNYENGKTEPKLETWMKLSDFFNVPPSYLMGTSNDITGLKEWSDNTGWSPEQIKKERQRLIDTGRLKDNVDIQNQYGYAVESLEQNIPTTTSGVINGVQSKLIELREYINDAFLEAKKTPIRPDSKLQVIKPGDVHVKKDMDEETYNELIDIVNQAMRDIEKIHSKK